MQRCRVLNLNDTSLEDEGVATLAHALEHSAPDLEELELALNEITPAGSFQLPYTDFLRSWWALDTDHLPEHAHWAMEDENVF